MSKPPLAKTSGKAARQSNGRSVNARVIDQAVADLDRRLQVLQPVLVARGLEPQRQARDLDQLGIEIDAVEVARQDLVVEVEIDRLPERMQPLDGAAVLGREQVERGDAGTRPSRRPDRRS